MSSKYNTIQQHEPLRAPAGWSTQEKRFVAQLEEILDDLYSRFNRLGLKDLNGELRGTIIKTADGVKENSTAIQQSSKSIQLIAKEAQTAKEDAEEALSTANEAKQSITPSAIVETVRSSSEYLKDLNNARNYALGTRNLLSIDVSSTTRNNISLSSSLLTDSAGGKGVRLSFDIKRTGVAANSDARYLGIFFRYDSDDGSTRTWGWYARSTDSFFKETDDDWVHVNFGTADFTKTGYTATSIHTLSLYGVTGASGTVEIRNVKVEITDQFTDWTPAPEDMGDIVNELDGVDAGLALRMKEAESSITKQADAITQKVSVTEYNAGMSEKADKSEIPDVSGLESRLTSAESTITQQADLISQKVSEETYNTGLAGKADKTEIPDVSGLASKSDIPDVSSKVESSEFTQKVNSISAIFKSIGLDGGQTGITSIGPNGLTVSHSNINYTTSLAADGMKIKDSSGNVVGGVYAVGGVAKATMQSLMNPKQTAFEVTVAPKDYDGEQYGLHLILNGEDIGQIFASSGALRIDTTKQLGLYSKGTSGAILSGNPVSIVSGSDVSFVYDGSNTASLKDMLSKLGSGGLKMACGSSSCSGSSNAHIYYGDAGFTSVPCVVVSYSKTGSNWSGDGGPLKVYNKTAYDAYVIVGGSFSSTRDFDWIAIGT